MLVDQAALNIRHWTGAQVEPAVLRASLDNFSKAEITAMMSRIFP